MNIFPNPFNDFLKLEYELETNSSVVISLLNAAGQVVLERELYNQESGSHHIELNTSNLDTGLYYFSVETERSTAQRKVILIR
jgi:hypothetical protein